MRSHSSVNIRAALIPFAMKKTLSLSEPLPIFWQFLHWLWPPPSAGSTDTPHEEDPSGLASKDCLNRAKVQSM